MIEKLSELSKVLKCDYVMVSSNAIYGTDINFAHLSFVYHTEPDLFELNNQAFIFKSMEPLDDLSSLKFLQLIDTVLNGYRGYKISLDENNLMNNELFLDIMSKKASEGISLMKIENYIFSINKSLLPVNKNDKLRLLIRDITPHKFLCEFIINKGKMIVYKFYMYAKL